MVDSMQVREETPDEKFRKLFDRTAKLNDAVSALLNPEWGAKAGIIPDDHPLHPRAQTPAADWIRQGTRDLSIPEQQSHEDAQRTTRRARLGNLLDRAARGVLVSPNEGAMLRQLAEAEMREVDTARSVAAGNKRHVQIMYGELQQAQAAIARVRALRGQIAEALEQADYRQDMRRGDLADWIMPVIVAALDGPAVTEG